MVYNLLTSTLYPEVFEEEKNEKYLEYYLLSYLDR